MALLLLPQAELSRMRESAKAADIWEAGVDRLLQKLCDRQQQQQQEEEEEQWCIQPDSRLLDAAQQQIQEQTTELGACSAAATAAW